MKGHTNTKLHHAYRYFHIQIIAVLHANVERNEIFARAYLGPCQKFCDGTLSENI